MSKISLLLFGLALYSAQAFAQESTLKVWMDKNVGFTADGKTVTYLTISEKDPNYNYIAFNMALTVPKGIKINKVLQGREYVNDIKLSDMRATQTHTISCNMPDDQTIKIISSSSANLEFYPDDIEGNPVYPILTIGLVADPSTYNGTYPIEMSDVWFVKRDTIGWKDETTPITELSANILDHIEYSDFNISGGTDFPGVQYTLPAEGYGTMIVPFNCEIPEGMKVYSCVGITGQNIDLEEEHSITANTPYIIHGKPGKYSLNGSYKGLNEMYSTQYMTGVYKEYAVPQGSYVMQNHQDTYGLGFYKVGEKTITISPYHCYLNAVNNNGAFLTLPYNDNTTGIDAININNKKVNVYNTQGQLIRSNICYDKALKGLTSGIYIINNQKFIVK